jgi:acetyl-CoA acetyltransferase
MRLNGDTAIAGIGQTEFSKMSGRSELQLAAEASAAAIRDAGLSAADIDGMVTFTIDTNDELALQRSLGITNLRWTARTPFGGGGACATVQLAAAAVAAGAANAVLIYRAFNERSERRFGQPPEAGAAAPRRDLHFTFGLDTPGKIYSLWYRRYLEKYGVTNADLGAYVVTARDYAATNPAAWFYQRPITLADHQASRWIVEPILRLMDCCQESDGGVALVVTSAERARDLPQPLVRILGASQSQALGGDILFDYYREDPSEFPEARQVTQDLWKQTGLAPKDMDMAMLYENFSPVVFMMLEAHGFVGRGEARDFVASGQLRLGGALPTNTNGGLIGEGYIHGFNNITEAVRQMRGTAANQVAGAKTAFVSSGRSAFVLGAGG